MRQMCVLLMVLGMLLCGAAQAEILNPSFEEIGAAGDDIKDWWDSASYTLTTVEDGTIIPLTPYGVNWAEMGNERWMYQQIGTYGEGMDIDITFLLGQRNDKAFQGVHVSLLVGGDPGLATDVNLKYYTENPLVTQVGAVEIANSGAINPFAAAGIATSEQAVSLSTGTGYTVGAPLWIQFNKVTGTGRALVDNVAAVFAADLWANTPIPNVGEEDVALSTDLSWTHPTDYIPSSQTLSFRKGVEANEPNWAEAGTSVTSPAVSGAGTTVSAPITLDPLSTYYWKVESFDGTTGYESATWNFTTISIDPEITTQPIWTTIQPGDTTATLTVTAIRTDSYAWYEVSAPLTVLSATNELTTSAPGSYYCELTNGTAGSVLVTTDVVGVMDWQLVAHWDFGGTLADGTINGYDGVYVDPNELNPAPAETYTTAVDAGNLGDPANQAFIFDSDDPNSQGLHVQISGDPNDFNFYQGGYTVNAWIKTSNGGYGCPIAKQSLNKQRGFVLNKNGGIAIHTLRPDSASSAQGVNDGEWRMLTGTYDASTLTIKVYVDGIERDAVIVAEAPLVHDQRVTLGAGLADGTSAPYTGLLDEVSVWNYVRTPSEIADAYAAYFPNPQVMTDPAAVTVPQTTTAEFTIQAINADTYDWKIDGVSLIAGGVANGISSTVGDYTVDNTSANFSTLSIANAEKADEGLVSCEVSSDAGGTTPDESATAYLMTERLVGEWLFDGSLSSNVAGGDLFTGTYADPNEDIVPTEEYVSDGNELNGQSLYFNDDNNTLGYHVQVDGDPNKFNFYPQGYTASAWVKMTEGSYGAVVSKQNAAKNEGFILNHFGGTAQHVLRGSTASDNMGINDGDWHMMTGTYDADTNVLMLYVDGVYKGEATNTNPLPSEQPLIFGIGLGVLVNGSLQSPYTGWLDEVRIWSYPRTPENIAQEYFDMTGIRSCIYEYGSTEFVLDFDDDCDIDLADFSVFAEYWLDSGLYPAL